MYHFYAMVNDIAWACSIINIQMKSHVLYSDVCSFTVLRNLACNIKNEMCCYNKNGYKLIGLIFLKHLFHKK